MGPNDGSASFSVLVLLKSMVYHPEICAPEYLEQIPEIIISGDFKYATIKYIFAD